jgi:hypothetical protein
LAAALAFVLSIVTLITAGREVYAHKLEVQRTVYLEPAASHDLQIVIKLHVPSGDPRRTIDVLADANHDGHVSDQEMTALRRTLAIRALDGIRILADTSTLSADNVETKIRFDGADGAVDLMVHAAARLPERDRAVRLAVTTTLDADPLELVVLSGTRPVIESDRGRVVNGAFTARVGKGDRVIWWAASPPPARSLGR